MIKKLRSLWLPLVLAVIVAGSLWTNAAAAGKPVKIRFANLAYGLDSIYHELAIDKGIFAKYGIDLQVINFARGGPEAAAGVASGQVDMGSFGTPILTAISKGIPIKVVAAPPVKKIGFILVARQDIKSVSDLKGKTVATGALGGGNHQSLLKIIYAHGLTDKDVKIVATGGVDEELILKSGRVEAVQASGVVVNKLVKDGAGHILAKAEDYYGHYQHSYVFATEALIKNNPEAIRNFLKASREEYQYGKDHLDELVAYAKKKITLDADLIRDYYVTNIQDWDLSFAVDIEGTANAVKILKELDEIDKNVNFDPKTWLDLRFLK
jgi:NitT/TauT family transport system substrate-binding protein